MELIIRSLKGNTRDEVFQYHEIESLNLYKEKPREIIFVTGNKNKVAELGKSIQSKLNILDLNLPEIQDSNSLNIVEDKCRRALNHVRRSDVKSCVLIEDTSLCFNALNGMPGPYVKWFVDAIGPDGLYKMLSAFEDKSAKAICTYALMEDEDTVVFCRGTVDGRITSPRGEAWGWDPIFEEDRTRLRFSEMDMDLKSRFSHRANALTVLTKYLNKGC